MTRTCTTARYTAAGRVWYCGEIFGRRDRRLRPSLPPRERFMLSALDEQHVMADEDSFGRGLQLRAVLADEEAARGLRRK